MKLPGLSIKPQNMLTGGALLAPVVLVQIVRLVLGSHGPSTASAGQDLGAPTAPVVSVDPIASASVKLDAAQKKAVEWLASSRSTTTVVESPFPKQAAVNTGGVVSTTNTFDKAPSEIPAAIKSLSLSSMLRAGTGVYATLSSKVYTVGDEVIDGWTIGGINLEAHSVTLNGPDGRQVTISHNDGTEAADSTTPQPAQTPTPMMPPGQGVNQGPPPNYPPLMPR